MYIALGEFKAEIEKRFERVVYEEVYVLSKNTKGKYFEVLTPLYHNLGVEYLNEEGNLTSQAYKLRLLNSPNRTKHVKIADMIHNTSFLVDLKPKGIERKIHDGIDFYIPLGRVVAPLMIRELETNIMNYFSSSHNSIRDN